jgi:23S rRNA (guanosine2251-2'-O)-methyltransferase
MGRTRTTEGGAFVVHGANAVLAALRAGAPVQRLVLALGRHDPAIEREAAARRLHVERGDRRRLDDLARNRDHQGAIAFLPHYRYAAMEQVLAPATRAAVVLDGVQDPRNLGAIIRTARAAGVGAVVLPKDRSVGVTGVVAAASAGTLFDVRVCQVGNLVRALEAMKDAGFWLVGLTARAERSLFALDPPERPALVVGGEGEGLRPLVRRTCDFEVSIPMAAGVESLNVSVAVGIALYRLVGRRLDGA